ncbi:MAG: sugar ABC transporter permease [Nitrososphaerales archaeon]
MGKRRESLHPYIFLSPALAVIFLLAIYPFAFMIYITFNSLTATTGPDFIGLANYFRIPTDKLFWDTLRVTLIFVGSTLAIELALGIGLALLLERRFKGKRIILPIIYIPMIITPVAIGLTYRMLLDAVFGPVNYFLSFFGVRDIEWVASTRYSLLSIILIDVWQWTPFVFLIVSAGLQSIPAENIEASLLDGASYWQRLRYITFDFLKPYLLVILLIRTIDAFKFIDIIYTVTGGGPGTSSTTLSFYGYIVAFVRWDVGYAATVSLILFFIVLIPSILFIRILSRR